MNRRISDLTRSRWASSKVMGSRGLVEKHHEHLGDQVRDHERRFLARSVLLCLRSYLLC